MAKIVSNMVAKHILTMVIEELEPQGIVLHDDVCDSLLGKLSIYFDDAEIILEPYQMKRYIEDDIQYYNKCYGVNLYLGEK